MPELRLDATNAAVDARTMLGVGDGTALAGRLSGSVVYVSPAAAEAVKGVRRRNGRAAYAGGSGTRTLRFEYVVDAADAAAPLDAVALRDASPSVQETPRKPGVFGLWRPLSRSHSSRFGSFLDR